LSVVNSTGGLSRIGEDKDEDDNGGEDDQENIEKKIIRDDLMNPYWIEDKDLRKAEVDFLTGKEIEFWNDLIDK
jgi:chitin synthase